MQDADYAARIEAAKRHAHGRWTDVLGALGLDERMLKRKSMACPVCQDGEDRFQYRNKFQEGDYFCRKCGAGDGFKLLMACKGLDFHAALCAVEQTLGVLPERRAPVEPSSEWAKKLAQRIWNEALPVTPGDAVDRYLRSRRLGLDTYPASLRFHPALGYYKKEGEAKARKVAEYPAMLASVQSPQGLVTLHRTYLPDGHKLDAEDVKKLLSGGYVGASVRLAASTDELAVCEGIETGIAIFLATGKPVWCAMNAGNLEKLWVPDTVRRLCIYGDNDAGTDFTGQASAYALARRARRDPLPGGPRHVDVFIPKLSGTDWADVWGQRQEAAQERPRLRAA